MQQKMNRIKQLVFVALAIQLAVIILLQLIFKLNILPGILVLIAEALIAVYLIEFFQSANEEESIGLEKYLGGSYADAYLVGGVGMMKTMSLHGKVNSLRREDLIGLVLNY
mgnify:CR=1 FL=1